jgi:hypothetical protein
VHSGIAQVFLSFAGRSEHFCKARIVASCEVSIDAGSQTAMTPNTAPCYLLFD